MNNHQMGEACSATSSIIDYVITQKDKLYLNYPYVLKGSWVVADDSEDTTLHSPHRAFWVRGVFFYEILGDMIKEGYEPHIEDYALIINDIAMSLYFLFGRNWTEEIKNEYSKRHGTPPENTRNLLSLIGKYYPKAIGWDLKNEDETLYKAIEDFINNCYQNLFKHFEYNKFQETLSYNYEDLAYFMEITRQVWFWFMKKKHNKDYNSEDDYFKDFTKDFNKDWREYYKNKIKD